MISPTDPRRPRDREAERKSGESAPVDLAAIERWIFIICVVFFGIGAYALTRWIIMPPRTGCVVEGQVVSTPAGPVRIEDLEPGDQVTTGGPDGGASTGTITAVLEFRAVEHLRFRLRDGRVLRVTGTHPVRSGAGFVPAGRLRVGDAVLTEDGEALIAAIREVRETRTVYDLTVEPDHNFFVEGVLVHNKLSKRR